MDCPKCGIPLRMDLYEGVEIDQCSQCGGTWLDEGELTAIVNIQEEKFGPKLIQETLEYAFAGIPHEEIESTVACPICLTDMYPVNYAFSSGVILNRCSKNHGIWLDRNELEKVQIYKEDQARMLKRTEPQWNDLAKSIGDDFRAGEEKKYLNRTAFLDYIIGIIFDILSKFSDKR